jgi:hypothetical protein
VSWSLFSAAGYLHGTAPPPGGEPLDTLKVLMPADWGSLLKKLGEFA